MLHNDLLFKLALSQVPNIGPVNAKTILAQFECAEDIFKAKKGHLLKVSGLGPTRVDSILNYKNFSAIENELKFIEKHKIEIVFFNDKTYPQKLLNCIDSPYVLFYKGNASLNNDKTISIVGSRKCTNYGRKIIEELCEGLAPYNPLIVSGLALGIDIAAHKSSLKNNLKTIGVLAHGLDRIYPDAHRNTAKEMVENGGLLSEYFSGTIPDKENFPTRNRIVAGMADATIVIETDVKGGSMITANLANNYNKDVMAYPGDIHNKQSSGCNFLIKSLKANMITEPQDLIDLLNWETKEKPKAPQRSLFIELTEDEKILYDLLSTHDKLEIDELNLLSKLSPSKIAGASLSLEMQGILQILPGKVFKLV
jgi:DNA processing protein